MCQAWAPLRLTIGHVFHTVQAESTPIAMNTSAHHAGVERECAIGSRREGKFFGSIDFLCESNRRATEHDTHGEQL